MQREDFIITMTDVREVVEDKVTKVKFRVSSPGHNLEGQETEFDKRALNKLSASWENMPPTLEKVTNLGQLLGDALFPQGPLRDAFLGSLSLHKSNMDSRLRVVLLIAQQLQQIPWEFTLFHTEQGEATQNEMLGLMSQVSIVRQLDKVLPNLSGVGPATHPTRMVMAMADPEYTLDLEQERAIAYKRLMLRMLLRRRSWVNWIKSISFTSPGTALLSSVPSRAKRSALAPWSWIMVRVCPRT